MQRFFLPQGISPDVRRQRPSIPLYPQRALLTAALENGSESLTDPPPDTPDIVLRG
jgi:hypothetical protein